MYIVIFRSRTSAVKFHDEMTRCGTDSTLINTPKSVGHPCGLSVKTYDLFSAKRILSSEAYRSFDAIYEISGKDLIQIG